MSAPLARIKSLVALQYQAALLDAEVRALARSLGRRAARVPSAGAHLRRLRWFRRALRRMVAQIDDAATPAARALEPFAERAVRRARAGGGAA